MSKGILKEKSKQFALDIIRITDKLYEKKQYVLARQLLRSGTSVGALIRESEYAQSRADFISELSIALKEANESLYWLELLSESHKIEDGVYAKLSRNNTELIKLLTASINTAKKNK